MLDFAVSRGPHKKPTFNYRLPLVGHVCRHCWISTAGYVNPNNGRVRTCEADIRKGYKAPRQNFLSKRLTSTDRSTYARAYLRDYVIKHSQFSPSHNIAYVDFHGFPDLWAGYELERNGRPKVQKSCFRKLWEQVQCEGVTCPETGTTYFVKIRKTFAKGFSKCDDCEKIKAKIAGTTNKTKKERFEREKRAHIDEVLDDREQIAAVKRKCMTDPKHAGFYLDAQDSAKYQLPTTNSQAKVLSQLWRLRQKLSCIQMFDQEKSLAFFRTLPDVPTGANLTVTILAHLMSLPTFKNVEDLHINIDGAGDNINYTLMYSITHLLLSAKEKGWALRRIHLYRPKVGHTHCELDATFALLSMDVYGKHSRGSSRKNILYI